MMRAAIVCLFLALLSDVPRAAPSVSLGHARYHASGRGDVTTTGSIAAGERLLAVDDPATWHIAHGIRVRRAGEEALVHTADDSWRLPPTAAAGATVSHDAADRMEGTASVRCSFAGIPVTPVDVCEMDLGAPANFHFDELRLWLKSSVATSARALRLRILRYDDPLDPDDCGAPVVAGRCPSFELEVPPVPADTWQELFIELKRTAGHGILDNVAGGQQVIVVECRERCDGLDVHLDDLRLVRDLVAAVTAMPAPGMFQLSRAAGRTVAAETVYHDDTVAVRTWLEAADIDGGARLVAPGGIYYINGVDLYGVGGAEGSYSLPLFNDTHLRCESRRTTIFKNVGRSATGPGVMFRSFDPVPANITIENCGFDWNGWNLQDFLTVFMISPHTVPKAFGRNIVIRGNRFFDSQLPGMEGCDLGQDECRTRQRHHILVPRVDGLWVEYNQMSGGGRIKSGGSGLGRNMHITNNSLQFVNDNAITIVDTVPGLTEHVEIAGNTISNPVASGIFIGADGEDAGLTKGMILRDVSITHNRVSGFFATAGIIGQLPRTAEDVTIADNVVINARQTGIPIGSFFAGGIILTQRSADAAAAARISVVGNAVIASGTHSVLNLGGILLRTASRFSGLAVSDNHVDCSGCSNGLAAGIWLWSGGFDHVTITGNRVANAYDALQLGGPATFTNVTIDGNTFMGSWGPSLGQITLQALPDSGISARIANNVVIDGAGYGVLCTGGGAFVLADLETNTFVDNAGGNTNGCEQKLRGHSAPLGQAGSPAG
jgi:hypothetical protein